MSFEQMAGQLSRLGAFQAKLRAVGDVTSESGHVRSHLLAGPRSTQELMAATGLTDKQVWGRLKYDLQQGRVRRVDHQGEQKFELVPVDTEAIDAAVKLLRRCGYHVTRIKRSAS
jgi:DNA-binding HxlR family transcriptional regulator